MSTDLSTPIGSYFISNYPPYSYWQDNVSFEVKTRLMQAAKPATPFGIYLHIPFCRKRCKFCYFKVYTNKNSNEIEQYLTALIQEIQLYKQQLVVQNRKPLFIYFGGGTPSYLSSKQFGYLVDEIKKSFSWDEVQEITYECEPGTLSEKKLIYLKELGITRLSFGVENFNESLLELNGRAHKSKEIYVAYDLARKLNFKQINIDLIAGMLGETAANWQQCIQETIRLSPDSVTIYPMEIPKNTWIAQTLREGNTLPDLITWDTKQLWIKQAFSALENAGYTIVSAYTAVKCPENTHFMYRDMLWQGADLLALGVSAFGYFDGTHYQNKKDLYEYQDLLKRQELPIARGLILTDEEKFLREFILQFKRGEVSETYFSKKFNQDILITFKEQWLFMYANNFIVNEPDRIKLTRDALVKIDSILPLFFLTKHQEGIIA